MSTLKWPKLKLWQQSGRYSYPNYETKDKKVKIRGFYKNYENFQYHWLLQTGRMVRVLSFNSILNFNFVWFLL